MKRLLIILMVLAFGKIGAQDQIKLKTGDVTKGRVTKVAGGKVFYIKSGSGKKVEKFYPKGDVEYIKYGSGKVVFMEGNKMRKPAVRKAVKTKK